MYILRGVRFRLFDLILYVPSTIDGCQDRLFKTYYIIFLSEDLFFTLTDIVDPDEMPLACHYVGFDIIMKVYAFKEIVINWLCVLFSLCTCILCIRLGLSHYSFL